MADDRYRRTSTNTTPPAPVAKRAASAASTRQPGSDPLVELARLIGQNEIPAHDPPRAGRAREERDVAEQRTVPRRQATPSQQASDRAVERGAQYERHPDQRYGGYTEPKPAASPQARGQTGAAHAPPDLSDPYRTDAGWRPPRPKERRARTDDAAAYRPGYGGDEKSLAERAPPPRAFEPTPPVASESRRPQAPAAGRHARSEPTAEKAYEQGEYYDDARAVADELGAQSDRHDEYDAYDYSGRDYEDSYEPRGRRLWVVVAILALAVIGTAGAYSYRTMLGGDGEQTATAPPVIRADSSPKKIASVAQPNGDKQIQERVGDRSTGERVVSREEQPLAIKDPNARALVPEPPLAVGAPATTEPGNAPAPAGAASEPKKVRTVTIRPEGGEPADAAPAPAAAASRAAVPGTPAPARTARPAAPTSSGSEPQSTAPRAAPARSQTALSAPPVRSESGFFVQLSAQKSQDDAQASFRAMQAKYPSVLSGRQPIIRRKEQPGKGVYFGAQVGPFASREEATQLCEELKAAGGSCFVQRN